MISSALLKLARLNMSSSSTPSKVTKLTKFIGTHDGVFHCDDVTACFMLKQLNRFKDHEIIRTRDASKLAEAEIIVDVGSELNIENLRLDHHQRSFQQTIKDYHPTIRTTNPTKPPRLSSSGLVYSVFGKDLITKLLNLNPPNNLYKELEVADLDKKKMVDELFEKAYIEFFEEIDAIDNGVEVATGDNLQYNYHINSGISARVGRLNPRDRSASAELRLENFKKAMELVGSELLEGIDFLANHWWPQRQEVKKFVEKRKEVDESGQIVMLGDDSVMWKSAMMDIEEQLGIVGEIKYVIYKDIGTSQPQWRVMAVPVSLKSFESRVPLKEAWRGKRDEELQEASGIEDATFVHMSGFTGGAKSFGGILKMARLSLNI